MEKSTEESIKITEINSLTVSAAVLGSIFGVTDRRIRQMAEEGTLIRAAKGRYLFAESVKSYILFLKMAVDANHTECAESELDFEEEKALHEKVKRHISELKLQVMKGELHEAKYVERFMADMLSSIKTRLLGIPTKLAPALVGRNEKGIIKEIIMKEVLEALAELKDYNPADFYGEEYVDTEGEFYEEG